MMTQEINKVFISKELISKLINKAWESYQNDGLVEVSIDHFEYDIFAYIYLSKQSKSVFPPTEYTPEEFEINEFAHIESIYVFDIDGNQIPFFSSKKKS